MNKPRLAVDVEKFLKFERLVLRRSEEEITHEVQAFVHWLQESYGIDAQTKLGKKFIDAAMTDLADPIVAAYVKSITSNS